jgi:hypothetical protein
MNSSAFIASLSFFALRGYGFTSTFGCGFGEGWSSSSL